MCQVLCGWTKKKLYKEASVDALVQFNFGQLGERLQTADGHTEGAGCLLENTMRAINNNEYLTVGNKCFVVFCVLHLSLPTNWLFSHLLLLAKQELSIGFVPD